MWKCNAPNRGLFSFQGKKKKNAKQCTVVIKEMKERVLNLSYFINVKQHKAVV